MKKKLLSIMLSVAMIVGVVSGCGSSKTTGTPATGSSTGSEETAPGQKTAEGSSSGDKLTIGISIRSMSSEYHMQYVAGAKAFLATLPEGTAEIQVLPCESNDDKQINDIKALVASKGKNLILFVDPNNAPNVTSIAEICEDAGVYWCSAWNTPEGIYPNFYKYWVNFQSCDGVKQGYDLAKTLFDSLETPGKGKILVMEGMLANSANVARMKGLKQALEEYPDIEILDDQAADWDTKKALSITESWLSKYNDVDGIWCDSDDMAMGCIQALKAKGLNQKVKVTGNDGTSDAIKAVETGDLLCTIANNGWLQGGYGVAYAYAAYTGKLDTEKMPLKDRMFYTNGILVTKDTIADYKKTYVDSTPVYDYTDLAFPIARPMDEIISTIK